MLAETTKLPAGPPAVSYTHATWVAMPRRYWAWLLLPTLLAGCEASNRGGNYPAGALQVRYESATHHDTCLVASVAMAANYLLNEQQFTEDSIRQGLQQAKLDPTRIGDVETYMGQQGLHLVTLRGRMDGKPPASLRYWLLQRGYPVVCVINRQADNPDYNHAVVVIGISQTAPPESADMIHYLDPASPRQLHSQELGEFESLWSRGQNAMLIVVAPPGSRPAS